MRIEIAGARMVVVRGQGSLMLRFDPIRFAGNSGASEVNTQSVGN